jgi:hypothetical protein
MPGASPMRTPVAVDDELIVGRYAESGCSDRGRAGLARGQRFDAAAGLLPARVHEVYIQVDDPAAKARLAATLARIWAYTGQPGRAAPFADQAVEIARTLADPVVLADSLDAALAAHWVPTICRGDENGRPSSMTPPPTCSTPVPASKRTCGV